MNVKDIKLETSIKLKGFAILSVFLAHLHGPIGMADKGFLVTWIIDPSCAIGMFLFLFLSGYGIYKSYLKNGLNKYWEKKIEKVFLPAIFCEIILSIFYILILKNDFSGNYIFETWTLKDIRYNGPLWYIQYIFIWYFIFYVMYKYVKNNVNNNIFILIWILISLGFYYIGLGTFIFATSYRLAFPLGVFYASLKSKEIKKSLKYTILSFISLILSISLLVYLKKNVDSITYGGHMYIIYTLFENIVDFLGAISLIYLFSIFKLNVFQKLGVVSFDIFLLHVPLIIEPLKMFTNYNKFLILITGLAITFISVIIIQKVKPKIIKR